VKTQLEELFRKFVPINVRNYLKKNLLFLYYGSRYECPFCHGHFRKFLPYSTVIPRETTYTIGVGPRENCYCPRCFSKDRERLIYIYLIKKTNIFNDNLKLWHCAPEKNLSDKLIASKNIDYLSSDLSIETAMKKIDITDIPFNDNCFDVIMCNHVIQYVIDDKKAMLELFRVLKFGGMAILQVPICPGFENTLEDPPLLGPGSGRVLEIEGDHMRIYGRDYKEKLQQAGFLVEEFKWTSCSEEFGGKDNKFALLKDETLYVGRKPVQ